MAHTRRLAATASSSHPLLRRIARYRGIYLIMLPGLVYYLVYKYLPMYGVVIAFKDISPLGGFREIYFGGEWVGLKYFERFVSSFYFWNVVRNTLVFSLLRLLLGPTLAIVLALLLNEVRNLVFKRVAQTVSYLPHFISWVVVASLVHAILSVDGGLLNLIITGLGGEAVLFLGEPRFFRVIALSTWMWHGVGWGSIIYLAAIAGIDPELYDAAIIDGAGRIRQVFAITIPTIAPIIVILLILRIGDILDGGFDLILNIYSPGVYGVADIIDTLVYREGLLRVQYSYAAAVGMFKSVIGLLLVVVADRAAKQLGQSGLW